MTTLSTQLTLNLLTQLEGNLLASLVTLDVINEGESLTNITNMLENLTPEVEQQLNNALHQYEILSSNSSINNTQFEQVFQENKLALANYSIDLDRYQNLTKQQEYLTQEIAQLTQHQTNLVAYFEKREAQRQDNINSTEDNIVNTEDEITNFKLVDPKTLIKDTNLINNQITQQQILLANYQQQLTNFTKSQNHHQNSANYYANIGWKWGFNFLTGGYRYQDPEIVKLRNVNQNKAIIYARNVNNVNKLISEINQQISALNHYKTGIEEGNKLFNNTTGTIDDASQILAVIKEQNNLAQAVEKNYFDQVALVELQRVQNQDLANWYNSQINQNIKSLFGGNYTINRPEYIELRNIAQNLANQANKSFVDLKFQSTAQKFQLESNNLTKLTQDLETRLDQQFPAYKEGIQAEIAAYLMQWQNQQNIQFIEKLTHQQQLELLQLKIDQSQTDLTNLQNTLIPEQEETLATSQERLLASQSEWETILNQKINSDQKLQDFLNNYSFFLSDSEKLEVTNTILENNQEYLDTAKAIIEQLEKQLQGNADPLLQQQLTNYNNYVENVTQESNWAIFQQANFNYLTPDPQEKAQIIDLINQFTSFEQKESEITGFSWQNGINLLQTIQDNRSNYLTSLDDLTNRIAIVENAKNSVNDVIKNLTQEYEQLDKLEKTAETNQLLSDKLAEIKLTKQYLAILESEFNRLSIPHNLFKDVSTSQDNFAENYEQLKSITETTNKGIKNLVIIHRAGENYRSQLDKLNTQLKELQSQLETESKDNKTDKQTANSLIKEIELIDLQLKTQQLHLNSLNQQKTPLLTAEAYFYRLADYHRVRISQGHLEAYKSALEKVSLTRQEYDQVLADITNTEAKITALQTNKTEKTGQLNTAKSDLISSDPLITQLQSQIDNLSEKFEQINTNLKSLQEQENTETKAFFTALEKMELLSNNLEKLTQNQVDLSQQLIELGLVASESDLNFFEEEIKPRIEQLKSQLPSRNQDFTNQLYLINDWKKVLEKAAQHNNVYGDYLYLVQVDPDMYVHIEKNKPDPVISNLINSLISGIEKQEQILTKLQQENTANFDTLTTDLETSFTALKNLRNQQKVTILNELGNNQKTQEQLSNQLAIEKGVNNAITLNNIESFAQLNQTLSEFLKTGVVQWTNDLKSDSLKTQNLKEIIQNFHQSFTGVLGEIQKLADTQGEYELNTTQLEESLRIVDVLINRQDILAQSLDSTEDAIELITKQLAQAKELQEKIGHLANLYELENAYKVSQKAKIPQTNNLNAQIQELSNKIKEFSNSDALNSQQLKDDLKSKHDLILQQDKALLNTLPSKALFFDGVNDYVQVGAKSSLVVTNSFTLEAWINPSQQTTTGGIIINKEGEYEIAVFPDSTIRWALAGVNWHKDWINTGYVVSKNQWTHIALTYDRNAIKLYGNGQLVHTYKSSVVIGDFHTNWNDFRIGGRQGTAQYFKGKIDEVRVWNKARSQEEIQTNMYNQLQGNETGLAGYWNFEEDTGTTTKDLTINGNNGTIYGSTWTTGFSEVAIPKQKDALSQLQTLLAEKTNPLLIQELTQEIKQLPKRYGLESEALQKYLDYRTKEILKTSANQEETIKQLQILRLEIAYFDVKFDQGSEILQQYLQGYEKIQIDETQKLSELAQDTPIINGNITAINYAINSHINYNPNQVRLTNIDGDQYLEALVFRPGSGRIFASEADGNQQMNTLFDSNSGLAGYNLLSSADRIVTFDYDGDRDTDIFLYRPGTGASWVARSNGDTTFTKVYAVGDDGAAGLNGIAGFNFLSSADIALSFDYNGDNKDDLFFYRPGAGAAWVARSNGDGSFTAVYAMGDPGSGIAGYNLKSPADRVISLDYDGDGDDDLFLYRPGRGAVWVARSNGNGTFTAVYAVGDDGSVGLNGIAGYDFLSSSDIALSFDYDGDKKDDLFLYRPGSGVAYVVKSNGNGTFSRVYGSGNGIAGYDFKSPSDRAFAFDYDADGDDDLFFYRQGVNNVWIARSNGDGTFSNLGRADANGIIQYEKNEITAKTNADLKSLRDQLLPGFDQDIASKVVNGEIPDELTKYNQDLEKLKNSINKNNAVATSSLIQADWYEKQAADHWKLSHKQGPTWSEFRRTYKQGLFRKKWYTVEIKHVDHHWIVWDSYTKLSATLRHQAISNISNTATLETEKQNLEELIKQWKEAYKQAGIAEETWQEVYNTLHQLFANQDLIDDQQAQLDLLQQLLPNLKEQFAQAQLEVDQANAQLTQDWTEYELASAQYIEMTKEIAPLVANLDRQAEEVYQQISEVENTIEQQNLGLEVELQETLKLKETLQEKLDFMAQQLQTPLYNNEQLNHFETQQALLQKALQLIDDKATILSAKQTYLQQQQNLLNSQKQVLQTEEDLVNAYLESPDDDWSNLEKQLENARNTLIKLQELAEQAKASSEALTTPLNALTTALLLQNDEHLDAIKDQQIIIKNLINATELNENFNLEAFETQQELNDLEIQAQKRLQDIAEAGDQQAQYLRDVARNNDFATAFEIYYRDYRDLTTDQKSSSAGGLATAQDWILAEHYYQKMVDYQQLKNQAQQQANSFSQAKEAAQEQLTLINESKIETQEKLAQLNQKIATTQEEIDSLNQELTINQNRINILEQLQNRTQETLSQLIKIEQFNLAQAQLEQQLAQLFKSNLDESLIEKLERDYLEVQLQRKQATQQIEYLNQLQSVEDLTEALNKLRLELGIESFEGLVTETQKQATLASLLPELNNAQQQPNLPDEIKALLTSTETLIHDALQSAEASLIEEKLLNTTQSLFEQVNNYNLQIAQLETQQQADLALLQEANNNLQSASLKLYEQVTIAQILDGDKELLTQEQLNVLHQVAYAQQGVTISSELAQKSKQIIEQIVKARIVEREVRKKAFLNELITVVGATLSVLGTAFSLAAAAPFFAASAATLKTISLAINAVNGVFKAVYSAANGDWLGAVYGLTMTVTNFVSGSINLGGTSIFGMSPDVVKDVLSKINDFKALASGLYGTIRSLESGDEIGAFLNVLGALSSVALEHINLFGVGENTFTYQIINSLRNVPLMIHNGIQAFESDDWLSGINNIFNAVMTLGSNFSHLLPDCIFPQVADVISKIEFGGNVGLSLATAIQTNSFVGWLNGVNSILGSWETYIHKQESLRPFKLEATLNQILNSADIQNLLASKKIDPEKFLAYIEENWQKIPLQTGNYRQGMLNVLGEIDPHQKTFAIIHGFKNSSDAEWVVKMGLMIKAQYPDANIILVDWHELASNPLYAPAANNTVEVGDSLAQKLHDLGIDFAQTTIIGHSLGAHVAANAGEYIRNHYHQTLGEIVALDPARPNFEHNFFWFGNNNSFEDRLDANDANKITVIHSEYNGLFPKGYEYQAGTEGIGYRLTSNGWEILDTNDLYLTGSDNQYYAGSSHHDAVSFYTDFLFSGADTPQEFFTIRHSDLAPIQGMLEGERIDQLPVWEQGDALESLPFDLQSEVVSYLQFKYPTVEAWENATNHQILVADVNGNYPTQAVLKAKDFKDFLYHQPSKLNDYQTYTVKLGDNPSKIAQDLLGRGDRFGFILTTNGQPLTNTTSLKIGDKLIIQNYESLQQAKHLYLDTLIANPKVKAFLDTISWAEGTNNKDGYKELVNPGGLFDSFKDHPRQYFSEVNSTAAGRYQMTDDNWDTLKYQIFVDKNVTETFNPQNQDRAAVQAIINRGALDYILKGNLTEASKKLQHEWESLPYGATNQPHKTQTEINQYYKQMLLKYNPATKLHQINWNNDYTDSLTGFNQNQILVAGNNSDLFDFTSIQSNFNNSISNNYPVIQNFDMNNDQIQLAGTLENYTLGTTNQDLPSGTGIYFNNGGENQLLAVIEGQDKLSLTQNYFSFLPK